MALDDCYLLQVPGSIKGESAVLLSPCYTISSMNDPVVLRFYHFTYGRDVGSLLVHVTEGCRAVSDWSFVDIPIDSYIWEVVGSQNNAWTKVELTLNVATFQSFQVIKTVNGRILITVQCYTYTPPTPPHITIFNTQTHRNSLLPLS